jgi:hypothetical protein
MLLNLAGKHLQNKPYTPDKTWFKSRPRLPRDATSSEPSLGLGRERWSRADSRLARGPPRAVSAPSAQAQLGQTLSCSDLGRIALPTDRIACTFNAGIA